jgi:hypothetical protein
MVMGAIMVVDRTKERIIFNAVCFKLRARNFGDIFGVLDQILWIGRPINFDLRDKMREGMRLDAHARNAQFLAFHNGGAGAAEGIENTMITIDCKTLDVLTNEMRREGKHKAVPVMRRTILVEYLIDRTVASTMTTFVLIRHRSIQRRFDVVHHMVPSAGAGWLSTGIV